MKNLHVSVFLCFCVSVFLCSCAKEDCSDTPESIKEVASETQRLSGEEGAIEALNLFLDDLGGEAYTKGVFKAAVVGVNKTSASAYGAISTKSGEGEDLPVYEITLQNADQTTGYAVVAEFPDFSEVMAYAPEGSIADTAFNEGLAMFFRDFATFAEFVGKKNTAQAEAATKADYYEVEEDPYYVYFSVPGTVESWRLAAGDPGLQRYYAPIDNTETYMARVQTKWHQEAPYNNQVPLIDYRNGNKTGRVGCFAVAFGQVMANHQRPTFYNWALLTVAPTISTSNSSAASEVSRLLYNIANRFTFFELTSTGTRGHTPLGNIVPGIQAQGYTVTETSYSGPVSSAAIYGEIRDNHRPLLMSGQDLKFAPNGQEIWSGHIWVIEGILKKERWYYWRSTVIEGTSYSLQSRERVRAQMILCNWGWGGLSDGWYYNFGPVYTDGKTYSFTYDKFLYTNIKPN